MLQVLERVPGAAVLAALGRASDEGIVRKVRGCCAMNIKAYKIQIIKITLNIDI